MTETEPSKCRYCGAETVGGDVCKDCIDNPERQEYYSKQKKVESNDSEAYRENEEPTEACEAGETFQYEGDRRFNGRLQVTALGFPCSRYMKLSFECPKVKFGDKDNRCEACALQEVRVINFVSTETIEGPPFWEEVIKNAGASAFATYFDTNNPRDALTVLVEHGAKIGCTSWRRCSYEGADERAVTLAVVMDPTATEARAWFVHGNGCDLKRCPNWILANGWVCRGQKGRIGIFVKSFKHESEITAPTPEDYDTAKSYLREITTEEPTLFEVARVLRKKSNLKGNESVRGFESDLLNAAAPVWTKTPEGPKVLSMTSCELGPTTSAKSLRERVYISWLEAGKYATGRQSHAGITAGVDKIEGIGFVVRKGLLPSADLSFLTIDNMPPHDLDDQIESRRNGVVSVSMIRSCEILARTRLKLLSNPLVPFESTLQKCVALRVYDPKLIARFTFAILTYGVDIDERYDSKIEKLTKEEEKLLQAAKTVIRWNLAHEITFQVTNSIWPLIIELSKQLEMQFGNEEIPLFLRANPHKIATLAYCFSLLEGTTPSERHVEQAYDWLVKCGLDMELDEFTTLWKAENYLKESEYKKLKQKISEKVEEEVTTQGGEKTDTTIFKFFEHIAKNQKAQMEEIAAALDVSNKTVKNRARDLKGLGLIKSGMSGYFLTPKGVKFVKRWLTDLKEENEQTSQQKLLQKDCPSYPNYPEQQVKEYNFKSSIHSKKEDKKTENNGLYPKLEVTEVTRVTGQCEAEKPVLNVYRVFNGEPCDCGLFAVTMELHDTVENTRKSYCDSCGKAEKRCFLERGYNIIYPSSAEAS